MAILPILKVIITIVRYFTLPLRENSLFYSPLAGELARQGLQIRSRAVRGSVTTFSKLFINIRVFAGAQQ